MLSFNRNSRRADCGSVPRALGAAVTLALVSATALAGEAHRFVFTAYSNAAGGADVVTGRYQAALEELRSYRGSTDLDSAAINTNRCVAYSMTLQWPQARAACDTAVHAAGERRSSLPAWLSWARASDEDYLALAYANRAVMYWLSNDEAAARKDLAAAQALAPQADFVAQNLAALKVHAAVALASSPAPTS